MRGRLAAVGAALVGVFMSPVAPAQAAAARYVALGDSYSSGTGTRTYIDDGTTCQRSVYAYPSLLASARGYALNFRACSGATISDVTRLQLSALSRRTAYVTISVGGNDAGFSHVLSTCAQPRWAADCHDAIHSSREYITSTLPRALRRLYRAIGSRAPSATVVAVGYPHIFDGTDCNALTWFSSAEIRRLNATTALLNSTTHSAASAAGLSFANPTRRFVGHAVCDRPEWINGLSSPLSESYHPKISGHRHGYLPTVSRLMTGSTATVSATVLQAARASSDQLSRQQRQYTHLDRSIEPETFDPSPVLLEKTG
jgi:lysophospholipase L1-like esterase